MADAYMDLVGSGFGKVLAKQLGLPQPPTLRRYVEGEPIAPGPVLLLGAGDTAQQLADVLLGWGLDVRRHFTDGVRFGAVLLVADSFEAPSELSAPALELGRAVKSLARGARVISLSKQAASQDAPAVAAVRRGIEGLVRSVARELRGGATANGLFLGDGVDGFNASLLGALRFFLSGKSAYVDGQFLSVSTTDSEVPDVRTAQYDGAASPLAGKVAVVTGAARGIGAAIARVLKRDGATVVVVDVPAAGDALTKVANELGGTALQLDITRADAGQVILDHARGRHGSLDIVVHNAGITRDKLLANMDQAKWDSVIAVNLESQLRMNEAFLAADLPGLRIVTLASTSGIAGNRGQTNYAASKAGVMGVVASTSPALEARGGGMNAVAPGFIETEMTAKIPVATRAVGRLLLPSLMQGGLPLDVAEAVSFLASPAANGINGQTLRVCGQSLIGA
ncbi:3-oxoacyl-ACP reductase [Neomicrococcus aestuarii]|uniref:3-oxoacyl-ACP reductase n=1 Tax=Neomicrococcus aestuarii TaxID=556325 RepID=A0A1L2ZMA2_9MICC|nr:3-oxoacyl-ACP reductase [Neomicrococcus aestuarii]APF40151.1 3-oxoacyl-ACP reductase [Neomicrococcus aestuarii]